MAEGKASEATGAQMRAICEISDMIDALFVADDPAQPLGRCMITFSRPSGRAKALGFFHPDGWVEQAGGLKLAEIAINPEAMALHGHTEVVQTLCHEKAHQWQEEHGKPSRGGYHNREWARKMERLGLMPSSTGAPGGNKTGPKMGDYLIVGGALAQLVADLPGRLRLPFMGLPPEASEPKPKSGPARFVCDGCGGVARAKKTMNLRCDDCDQVMEVEQDD
jgi:hypothetical protein